MKKLCSEGFKASSADLKALSHYLLDTPKEWANKALKGLINKAVKTILKDWLEKFKEKNPSGISANLKELIPAIIKMPEVTKYNREATEKGRAQRDEEPTIEIWEGGFDIEDFEYDALYVFFSDPEQTLIDYMENKIARRKTVFVKDHEDKLIKDPETLTIPSRQDALINLVTSKPDYKNRKQSEIEVVK